MNLLKRQQQYDFQGAHDDEMIALLEPGIEFEGKIKVATGMVRLNCRFKGEICSAGTVIVASEADVEANIEAAQISIAGKVKGNVNATKQLEITEQGILLGDVETPLLKIDPGAYFTGHCDMPTNRIEKSVQKETRSPVLQS